MKDVSKESFFFEEYKKRSKAAYVVCDTCGEKYGRNPQKNAEFRMGTCDICKRHKGITDFKNYGFSIYQ